MNEDIGVLHEALGKDKIKALPGCDTFTVMIRPMHLKD